jgi:hypothetical protein
MSKVDIVLVSYSSAIFMQLNWIWSSLLLRKRWLPVDQPNFALCPSKCQISRCSKLDRAILLIGLYLAGILVMLTTKLHKAIPIIGANACAAWKHTLLVVEFYFICSFLAMGCPTNFAARILKIPAYNWSLACTCKAFIWSWRAYFSMAVVGSQ